jgi:hypothetical protein
VLRSWHYVWRSLKSVRSVALGKASHPEFCHPLRGNCSASSLENSSQHMVTVRPFWSFDSRRHLGLVRCSYLMAEEAISRQATSSREMMKGRLMHRQGENEMRMQIKAAGGKANTRTGNNIIMTQVPQRVSLLTVPVKEYRWDSSRLVFHVVGSYSLTNVV